MKAKTKIVTIQIKSVDTKIRSEIYWRGKVNYLKTPKSKVTKKRDEGNG
ncbi:hypothetical protein PA598K_01698 [Paenibacillus sp. 598K]|nr:hypothetical protein PA598K_01698 [Paenibacillus sp. 598K]